MRAAYPGRKIDLEESADMHGRWDGHRLRQLLSNLVINAIKYGKADSPVYVTMTGTEEEICLEVRNTGEAIDPTILERIFAPLTRGLRDTNGDRGLGLGLYIASEIAKAHHGRIEALQRDRNVIQGVPVAHGRADVVDVGDA